MQGSHLKKRTELMNNAELFPPLIELLEQGHTVSLTLKGISMRPFLEDKRDIAVLKKATAPQVGEPVLAEVAPQKYVLHRLIAIDGEDAVLLGDGNLTTERCKYSDIKAQVVGFYRRGRKELDKTDGWKWKLYSSLWMKLRPIRRYLLAIDRRLKKRHI